MGRNAKSYVLPWEIRFSLLFRLESVRAGGAVSQFSADRRVEHEPWL